MRNWRQPPGQPGLTFGKNRPAHVFDVKMSEMTIEARSDRGVVTVHGYPEGVWQDAQGAKGLHLDTADHPTWLEIPFARVISWRPDNPEDVLSYGWRHFAEGGGPAELQHFLEDELQRLDRVSQGLDPWVRRF